MATERACVEHYGPLGRFLQIPPRGGVRAATLEMDATDDLASQARDAGISLPRSLQRAGATRRREYRAGRICARVALERLAGAATAARADLGADGDGVPQWPDGIVGSISHGAGMGFAAVARADGCGCLGVDVERVVSDERAARLGGRVFGEAEREMSAGLSSAEWFALAFSAKESAYKALFPLHRRFLGFADIVLVDRSQASGYDFMGYLQFEVESVAGDAAPYRTLRGYYGLTGSRGRQGADTPRVWTLVFGAHPSARCEQDWSRLGAVESGW